MGMELLGILVFLMKARLLHTYLNHYLRGGLVTSAFIKAVLVLSCSDESCFNGCLDPVRLSLETRKKTFSTAFCIIHILV